LGGVAAPPKISVEADRQVGPTIDWGKQKAPTHDERGRQNSCALLIFPKPMVLELELAPVIGTKSNRLPWRHRASPSTTRYESVISTDADRLIYMVAGVNWFFRRAGCVPQNSDFKLAFWRSARNIAAPNYDN
jgi:hypothetical protein